MTYYLTNTNCSSLGQTDILGVCKITLTKACQTFVLRLPCTLRGVFSLTHVALLSFAADTPNPISN